MQSENLLRSDYGGYDSDDSGSGGSLGKDTSIPSISPMPTIAQQAAAVTLAQVAAANVVNYNVSHYNYWNACYYKEMFFRTAEEIL